MKMKYFILLFIAAAAVSCGTDETRPSLHISEKDAQLVEVLLTTDTVPSPFYYLIQAGEVVADWGDKTSPKEYVFRGDWDDLSKIKPISYSFGKGGTYPINFRTGNLLCLDFSRGIDKVSPVNRISKIGLRNCFGLKRIYVRNQPISEIDLSGCRALEAADFSGSEIKTIEIPERNELKVMRIDSALVLSFDCDRVAKLEVLGIGNRVQPQSVSNIDHLAKLRRLVLKGDIDLSDLNLTHNDSLRSIEAINTNIRILNLGELNSLDSISLKRCKILNKLVLKANTSLTFISLKDNAKLDAKALNDIFSALPKVTGTGKTIVLSGNSGDATCDRSIATRKGWSFESGL